MTPTRDPDRMLRAWLDLMPDEAPDRAIAAVLQATHAAPQVRAQLWGGPRRSQHMNRISLITATGIVAMGLVGGAILFAGGQPRPTSPTPTPSSSVTTLDSVAPAPEQVWGDWLADAESIVGVSTSPQRIQLTFHPDRGLTAWVKLQDGALTLESSSLAAPMGEIRLRADLGNSGCSFGEDGRYRWSRSADGLFLTLTLIEDECAPRATAFERTWVRSLGAVNDGRRGVVNYFSPAILIELPEGRWSAGGTSEAADIGEDRGQNLVAVKNPAGLAEPCAPEGGDHVAVDPTIEAYSAYIETLPGFTVESADVVVGGYQAAHLTVTTDAGIDCPTRRVAEFAPNDLSETTYWFITPGDPDSIWLVQVDQDLYLLLYPGVTPAEEAQVISTAQFIDELPTP